MSKLLIVNNHDSFTYNLVDLFRQLSMPQCVVNVEELTPILPSEFSHILISPGPDVPQAYPKLFTLLEQYYQHKSILGICLGHQTLCEFFGATLYNLPEPRHGRQGCLTQQTHCKIFQHLPHSFHVGLYHSWAVAETAFPTSLQIDGVDEQGVIMAVSHKTYPLFGIQFHPESFISEFGKPLLQQWLAT